VTANEWKMGLTDDAENSDSNNNLLCKLNLSGKSPKGSLIFATEFEIID
jgi:hypothetical protein